MKKEDIIKCLHEATKKNVTEKGVEWKLLYEDGADAILKLVVQPDVSSNGMLPKSKIKKKHGVAVCLKCKGVGTLDFKNSWKYCDKCDGTGKAN